MSLLSGAMLGIMADAGAAVLTLTEMVEADALFASQITLQEVVRQTRIMAETASNMPKEIMHEMKEIDWRGWQVIKEQLLSGETQAREAIWFCVKSLIPATLMWIRFYQAKMPELFELRG